MEQKRKASEEPADVWSEKLFSKLRKLGFREIFFTRAKKAMNRDARSGTMPPEYKKRPRNQGMQRRFELPIDDRTVGILTGWSPKLGAKKRGYQLWIYMTGRSIKTKSGRFNCPPINDTPSLFEIAEEGILAFIDIATNWPTYKKGGKPVGEYSLTHSDIVNMVQFEYVEGSYPQIKRTSFLLIEAKFSERTMRFINKKFGPDYKKRKKAKDEGKELPKSRTEQRAEKREKALRESQS